MADKRVWPTLRLEVTGFTVDPVLWAYAQQAVGRDGDGPTQHVFPVSATCVLIVNGKLGRPLPGRSKAALRLAQR